MSRVPHETPHAEMEWLYARDVAADLQVTAPTARSILKRIPGAELLYQFEGRAGERWRISRPAYDAWRAEMRRLGLEAQARRAAG